MNALYERLSQDHKHLAKVLDVLKHQIGLYDTREESGTEKPNTTLIMDILDYVHYYPEAFHHPLEEATFDYLTDHNLGDLDAMATIHQEHKTLEAQSAEVRGLVQAILNGEPVALDRLCAELDAFHQQQLTHLEHEEKMVFQDIKALDEQASQQILDQIAAQPDPLFSGQAADQFRDLAEELT